MHWNISFVNANFLDKIKNKFGIDNMENINKLAKIELKRKILE